MTRALVALTFVGALGAAPTIPAATTPTATDVLARVTEHDARVESYAVPVHIDVRLHKLITFHFGMNGMQYFKRPDRLALEMRSVPAQYRKLFAELGSPLTWPVLYDLRMTGSDGEHGPYHLEGVPKRASDVARMLVDVDGEAGAPLHAVWTMRDGGTIDMRITEAITDGYQLPVHADADMTFGSYKIHASIDYGPYTINETVTNSVFAAPGA